MSINEIIPPEVLNDQFYFSLVHCGVDLILINDPNYKIIARDVSLRNGFAIFEKIS
jgi:hypothetical protein